MWSLVDINEYLSVKLVEINQAGRGFNFPLKSNMCLEDRTLLQ